MWETILNFLNQPVVIGALITAIWKLADLFLDGRPEVQKFIDKHKAEIIQVVKLVEKQIPDGTVNAGLARADLALKMLIEKAIVVDEDIAKLAITKVHSEIADGVK